VDSDDLAWIFYTSGTTGRPKGAMLTHRNLILMTMSYLCDVDLLGADDCFLHLGAQSHAAGLLSLPHLAKGSQQVLAPSFGFSTDELFDLLAVHRSATFFLSPTMLRRALDHPRAAAVGEDRIRTLICGAAPVYAEDVKRALAAWGSCFWNGYGQGECPCTITAVPKHIYAETDHVDYESRISSVGIARTGTTVVVARGDGSPAPASEVGEVRVRSDIVMRGYWNNPQETATALQEGWLATGDLGVMDEAGFLTLKGRSKDVVISGGANIYPREIEEVLLTHPDVAEVAVVGAPDPYWGERVVAFVAVRAGTELAPAALDALCLSAVARFKRPKAYRFLADLPKNTYGKVLKTELRRMAAEELSDNPVGPN
jgi:long-chain acyl-CoA synthetase